MKKNQINLPNRVHFLGIGGSGLSPLAGICLDLGLKTTGSDSIPNENQEVLKKKGAKIWSPHSLERIKKIELPELCVYSTAIPKNNPEYLYLKERQVKFFHRSDLLEHIANSFNKQIVITGTHGKTTVTAMLAWILEKSGFDDPTWIIGGLITGSNCSYKLGKDREVIIFEGDESDQSFLKSSPFIGLVTSLEPDHLENYNHSFEEQIQKFQEFSNRSKNFICSQESSKYFLKKSEISCLYGTFSSVFFKDKKYGKNVLKSLELDTKSKKIWEKTTSKLLNPQLLLSKKLNLENFFGEHNCLNALGALSAYYQYKLCSREDSSDFLECAVRNLSEFPGVHRRFEIVKNLDSPNNLNQLTVIDDYAHHPTEVKVTIEVAQNYFKQKKLNQFIVLFQPHLPTRLKDQWQKFIEVFSQLEQEIIVFINDLYIARGKTIEKINSKNLVQEINQKNIKYIPGEPENLVPVVKSCLKKRDLLLILGAGNITRIRSSF